MSHKRIHQNIRLESSKNFNCSLSDDYDFPLVVGSVLALPNLLTEELMLNRIWWLLLMVLFRVGISWAADSPFVGKWKLNPSRSKLSDEMKVERVSGTSTHLTLALVILKRL